MFSFYFRQLSKFHLRVSVEAPKSERGERAVLVLLVSVRFA